MPVWTLGAVTYLTQASGVIQFEFAPDFNSTVVGFPRHMATTRHDAQSAFTGFSVALDASGAGAQFHPSLLTCMMTAVMVWKCGSIAPISSYFQVRTRRSVPGAAY